MAFNSIGSSREDREVQQIRGIFRTFLSHPDAIPAERLLDLVREFTYGDTGVLKFLDLFMPSYYSLPLRDRLEAIRLGAFTVQADTTLRQLLSQDCVITGSDVSHSSKEKLSLMHSAAVALACRYPDELIPHKRPHCYMFIYWKDSWDHLATCVARVAEPLDLHSVELVIPWDANQVPVWKGTPLISVIGGVLCFASTEVTLVHWERFFQGTLHCWLSALQRAGVDLLEYGRREARILHDDSNDGKGAFDADAIRRSRTVPRNSVAAYSRGSKYSNRALHRTHTDYYWVPIRIIDLKTGSRPDEWQILWAPEFEYMANEFWQMIGKQDVRIPGAWVD